MREQELFGWHRLATALARSVGREEWMDRGRCTKGHDPDDAFAEKRTDGTSSRRAMDFKMTCGRCPVRRECLEFGLAEYSSREFGTYGGVTPEERKLLGGDVDLLLQLHALQVAGRLPVRYANANTRLDAAAGTETHTEAKAAGDPCPFGRKCPLCQKERKQRSVRKYQAKKKAESAA